MRPMGPLLGLWLVVVVLVLQQQVYANPLSKPHVRDDAIGDQTARYQPREPLPATAVAFGREGDVPGRKQQQCPLEVEVLWSVDLFSGVFSTPVIHHGAIVLSTLHHTVQVLDRDGFSAPGWPITLEGSSFHASPVLHDVNGDGVKVGVFSSDAHVFWLDFSGKYLQDYHFKIPSLTVKQGWYEEGGAEQGGDDLSRIEFELDESGGSSIKPRRRLATGPTQTASSRDFLDTAWDGQDVGQDAASYYLNYGSDDLIEAYWEGFQPYTSAENMINIDAHILAAPSMVDINADGSAEMIVAVSYFFDKLRYPGTLVGGDEPTKYVGGAILAYDLVQHEWLWATHLDLSTDETRHRAYLYASPTVAALSGEGEGLSIVVGTALGLLYVLDAQGACRPGFPVQYGEIQAQVAVADVVGDGDLELIFVDTEGTLACVSASGVEVWRTNISGKVLGAPMVGDVDGDGHLDVVVAVTAGGEGHLWIVSGQTGNNLPHFPRLLSKGGGLPAAVTLVDLHTPPFADKRGLHVVVPSLDGNVYIVEGRSGCSTKIDVGAHVYASVLVEDLRGDGTLNLIVTTMTGEVLVFDTKVPSHPLNTWTGHHNGRFVHGHQEGIFIHSFASDVLTFEIVHKGKAEWYEVSFSPWTKLAPVRYEAPGVYSVAVKVPTHSQGHTFAVTMVDDKGLRFEHAVGVSHELPDGGRLRLMVLLPFLLSCGPLLLGRRSTTPLPL